MTDLWQFRMLAFTTVRIHSSTLIGLFVLEVSIGLVPLGLHHETVRLKMNNASNELCGNLSMCENRVLYQRFSEFL